MSAPQLPQTSQPTLTSLDRLPPEIKSLILDAYILSTPFSSRSYQDILCLDHQTHNRAVTRLYDKVTLHADNARGFYAGLEDIDDLLMIRKWDGDEETTRRAKESEALVEGSVDYSHSRTARYPKHYLLRRVGQITFQHPLALIATGKAVRFFSNFDSMWQYLAQGGRPLGSPNQSLFRHVPGSDRRFCLFFPRTLVEDAAWEGLTRKSHATVSAVRCAFPRGLDLCLTLSSTAPRRECLGFL
ncbi:hypothetical protein IAT38_005459 [Cryptococcus sp. DSM 104549]